MEENRKINQISWQDPNQKYANKKRYLKTVPYVLRERAIFVCWKTVWKPTGKKVLDSNGQPIILESGDFFYYPLKDKDGHIVVDEKGKMVPDGKFTKVPFDPKTGREAKSNDRRTWGTFKEACDAVDKYKMCGIGIMFGEPGYANGVVGIDIDHVRDENGKLTEEAKDIIGLLNSYTEYSPSGTGIHVLAFAELPKNTRKRVGNIEIYGEGRFFTLTGDVVGDKIRMTKKTIGTENVKDVIDKYFGEANRRMEESKQNGPKTTLVQGQLQFEDIDNSFGLTDDEVIAHALQSHEKPDGSNIFKDLYVNGDYEKHFPDRSRADVFMCGMLAFYSDSGSQLERLMNSSAMYRPKYDERRGNATYLVRTIEMVMSNQQKHWTFCPNKTQQEM